MRSRQVTGIAEGGGWAEGAGRGGRGRGASDSVACALVAGRSLARNPTSAVEVIVVVVVEEVVLKPYQ